MIQRERIPIITTVRSIKNKREIEAIKTTLTEIETSNSNLRTEIEASNSALRTEIEAIKTTLTAIGASTSTLITAIGAINSTIAGLTAEVNGLKTRVEELEGEE